MSGSRGSLWLRWPDRTEGPLWLGVHTNTRAGTTVVVGIEVWTEEPGEARAALGPTGDPAADLLPWGPIPLRADDVSSLSLGAVIRALDAVLRASSDDPLVQTVRDSLRVVGPGRPPTYPPEHFARVAGVYKTALARGSLSPTADVAATWHVTRATAAKWVGRARKAGHLPPA